ncbi:hypothetical protein QQX98_007273 [Neonectria punicea]|uniref:Methyltransferase n=1 Tax=Neonectria punicea TaxID=979145 RepID=A0ABR1GYH2_9HYPO
MSALENVHERIEFDPDVVENDDNYSAFDEKRAPNDEKHLEAFDVAYQWLTMMLDDELYLPPIGDNPQRILDVGTGTGIWAIDMADKFPSAEVIGTGISPTQPSWVPPNLHFQIDDAQLDWTFQPEHFDFIHIRIFKQWAQLFYDAGDKLGRTFRFSDGSMQQNAVDAGFTEIVHKTFKLPMNPWPRDKKLKELGSFVGLYMDLSLDGFAMYPIGQILGWSLEETHALVARMRAGVRSPKNMTTGFIHAVYGQKPENPPLKDAGTAGLAA